MLRLECVKCNCKHQKILAVKRCKILNKEEKGSRGPVPNYFCYKDKSVFLKKYGV